MHDIIIIKGFNRCPFVGLPPEEGRMREDLKRMIDQLDEEDVYLLYVTALEMRRR